MRREGCGDVSGGQSVSGCDTTLERVDVNRLMNFDIDYDIDLP
jgi:hypothetical protein